jgi:thioredoxin 1
MEAPMPVLPDPGAVADLDDATFPDAVAAEGYALVDYFAEWCGPCHMFAPVFKKMAKDHAGVRFYKLDSERAPEARKTVKIPGLPYFALYKDGAFIEGLSTSKREKLTELLARHGLTGGA